MELENKMLIDDYWLDYSAAVEEEDRESDEEWLARIIEEEDEEDADMPFYAWQQKQNGYHF